MSLLRPDTDYIQKELAAALGIKDGTFRNNKKKYIEELDRTYYYYTYRRGQSIIYHIIDIKDPSDDFCVKPKARKKKDEILKPAIREVLMETPWQSGSSMGRSLYEREDVKALQLVESTLEKEARRLLKEMCGDKPYKDEKGTLRQGPGGTEGIVKRMVFCGVDVENNKNVPLSGELKEKYNDLIIWYSKQYEKKLAEIFAIEEDCKRLQIQLGNEIKEKKDQIKNDVIVLAKTSFKERYKMWPMWLPEYMLYAWPSEMKNRDIGDADMVTTDNILVIREGDFEW